MRTLMPDAGTRITSGRRQPPDARLVGALVAAAVVLLAATWNAMPWNWAFLAFYIGLAFLLEVTIRLKSHQIETTIQVLVLSGSAPFVFSWFFGEGWQDTVSAVHLGALTVLATIGYTLVYWLGLRSRAVES